VKPRVLDERVTWLISDILSDDDARSFGFGRNSVLHLERPAAVKTGTTSNFHDNWTIGYTPDLVVGVWVGNTDHKPMRNISGVTGAGPIWHQFIRSVLSGSPEARFIRPAGLGNIEVCALSGLLPTPDCPYRRYEWFIEGTQPIQKDNIYQEISIDEESGELADVFTPNSRTIKKVVLNLPPSAAAWAKENHIPLLTDYSKSTNREYATQLPSVVPQLHITSPRTNAVYILSPGFGDSQRLQLQAVIDGMENLPAAVRMLRFWIDGKELAEIHRSPYETWWELQLGKHQLKAQAELNNDERIDSEEVFFEVLAEARQEFGEEAE